MEVPSYAEAEHGASARSQRLWQRSAQSCDAPPAFREVRLDVAAEYQADVAAIRDRHEQGSIRLRIEAHAPERKPPQHESREAYVDTHAEPCLDVDAACAAQRPCRQQHENTVVAGLGTSRRCHAHRHDRGCPSTKRQASRNDAEPCPGRRLPVSGSSRHVDHHPLGAVVSQLERPRARPRQGDARRGNRQLHPRWAGECS
jgi:hypothetical protein